MVRNDAHRLEVVAILTLPRRLLHSFVWNLKTRERVTNNESQPVMLRKVAFVVQRKIPCRAPVREILRHNRIQVVTRHTPGSAAAERAVLPRVLGLGRTCSRIETAARKVQLAM